jgi:hypothetical protein
MNAIARFSIAFAVLVIVALLAGLYAYVRSDYATGRNIVVDQPVPFSHRHHVAQLGMDCRYCHHTVETSSFAGIPATEVCMGCHNYVWTDAEVLAPVRESYRTGEPIVWNRVHRLAGFSYFDHSIHVAKGVACTTCHGEVHRMALVWQAESLLMPWCLDCHRNPENYVRPRETVFDPEWVPDEDPRALGRRLVEEYDIEARTSCSTCHR